MIENVSAPISYTTDKDSNTYSILNQLLRPPGGEIIQSQKFNKLPITNLGSI
jgi:hypothetical protein